MLKIVWNVCNIFLATTEEEEEEDGVNKFWQAKGRGCKEAREEEKGGSNQQAGAEGRDVKSKGRKSTIFN